MALDASPLGIREIAWIRRRAHGEQRTPSCPICALQNALLCLDVTITNPDTKRLFQLFGCKTAVVLRYHHEASLREYLWATVKVLGPDAS
jgi:hypothetical protein